MATKEYLDLEGLAYFKQKQDLQNASTYATTSYVNTLVGSSVASAYKFKGSKDTVASLPSSGNTVGDVWNVTATGMNYAWDGSAWDALGTTYSEATSSAAGLMSAADKARLDGLVASGGEPNQNAFARVSAGGTAIVADLVSDTLNIVAGENVSISGDASTDTVTIAATDTTYSEATTSAAGLMTAAMVTKLDGIAEGATKVTVDSALSDSSANPVQNKVVNTALVTKAPLASPAFTGTPTAPTAASGTSTTQVATTAFVQAATEPIATSVIDALFS